jgi:DNA helicase-4
MYDSSAISKKLDDILKRRLNKYISGPILLGVKEALEPYETALKSYLGLIKRTIDFIKVTGSNPKDAVSKGTNDVHERVSQFYILFERIWESYHRLCAAKSYLDFNDLMIKSNDLLSSNSSIKEALQTRFQYILVDEFQDVNIPQVNLIKSLITPNTQLFCVGDDWQSIYGFRGSVVDYIVNFDEYFPDSKKHFLNLNYRSNHSIVTTGNEVIKRNEKKIEKEIESHNKEVTEILLYLANEPDTDDVDFFVKKVNELNSAGYDQDDILVLYRRTAMAKAYRAQLKESGGHASFKTIHASKGMEAKVVFILGLNKNQGGFPDVWLNDRLFQVIREQDIKDLMEEERRLFYVAITRAKEHLFLMSAAGSESEFLIDLPKEFVKRISVQMNSASGIMQCENCGKITYGKSEYCSGCGNKLSS